MKRFLMLLTIAITCLSLFATVAEAKRFGGGSSFGKQRTIPSKQAQKTPATTPAPAAPASGANKWLGPLAGLAVGAGLASMFAGGGLGGLGSMMGPLLLALIVVAVVMFMVSKFRRPQQPAMQYAGSGAPYNIPEPSQQSGYSASALLVAGPVTDSIPHDFPVESFLRNAKISFIRLQAANDRKDMDDVREYTTPEMFAENSMQIRERGDALQKTDVIVINAELLEVAHEGEFSIASVRFTGQLQENNGAAESVDEIWHLQKNLRDNQSVWLLAGIQQVIVQ